MEGKDGLPTGVLSLKPATKNMKDKGPIDV